MTAETTWPGVIAARWSSMREGGSMGLPRGCFSKDLVNQGDFMSSMP